MDAFEDPFLFIRPELPDRRIAQRVAERLTDDAVFDVSGNTVLDVWWKRAHPSGLDELGRRAGNARPTFRAPLSEQASGRFVFRLGVGPRERISRHQGAFSNSRRRIVSEYCKCPFTWLSVRPSRAAISARVMPCT